MPLEMRPPIELRSNDRHGFFGSAIYGRACLTMGGFIVLCGEIESLASNPQFSETKFVK
jgi:hypothetical protein